jgi:hypothetical protein
MEAMTQLNMEVGILPDTPVVNDPRRSVPVVQATAC